MKSICPYCGCGCRLSFLGNSVRPDPEDPVSLGKPCVKGLTVSEVFDRSRLKHPMIRIGGGLREVSWKRALETVKKNVEGLSPEEIAFYGSGKVPNEDNWALLKFAKIVAGTNNTDSCCGRLCHIATVSGFQDCFGNSNLTRMDYVNDIDTLFVIGSNPATNYPVFFNRVKKRDIKVVSVQPFFNATSGFGETYIIEPGTEVVLLNGIMNYIISRGLHDPESEKIEGFELLKRTVSGYGPEVVERFCGLDAERFEKLASAVGRSDSLGVFHGMGLTQHLNAVENVHSLANLVLLKSGKVLSLRGEVNVQGVGDIGFLPDRLPSGGFETLQFLEKVWGHELPVEKGKTMIESVLTSPADAIFITSFNPAQSMPALGKVHKNLENSFVVLMESHESLTAEFADVLLPVPALFEREGTITNGEKRIRLVRKVREPPGEARREIDIVRKLAALFGKERFFSWNSPKEVFEEIVKVVPAYRRVDPSAVYSGEDVFADKTVRWKRFFPEKFEGKDEMRSGKYPFLLTTARSRFQFLTGEMTGVSPTLSKLEGEPGVKISKVDAENLGLKTGSRVKLVSEEGSLEVEVEVSEGVPAGLLVGSFHSRKMLINTLFPARFDEETHTPNYKCVAVRIEPLSP